MAEIHISALPYDFCSLLGNDFLQDIYYTELLNMEKTIALCAVGENCKDVFGFIIFQGNEYFFKKLFFKYFAKILVRSLRSLTKKGFFLYALSVLLLVFCRKKKPLEDGYELNYIAIDANYQKHGIGKQLLSESLDRLNNIHSDSCWVKTLKRTPETISFYKKNGFEIYDESFGRVYLYRKLYD